MDGQIHKCWANRQHISWFWVVVCMDKELTWTLDLWLSTLCQVASVPGSICTWAALHPQNPGSRHSCLVWRSWPVLLRGPAQGQLFRCPARAVPRGTAGSSCYTWAPAVHNLHAWLCFNFSSLPAPASRSSFFPLRWGQCSVLAVHSTQQRLSRTRQDRPKLPFLPPGCLQIKTKGRVSFCFSFIIVAGWDTL
jgi:hypothetical protein